MVYKQKFYRHAMVNDIAPEIWADFFFLHIMDYLFGVIFVFFGEQLLYIYVLLYVYYIYVYLFSIPSPKLINSVTLSV